MGDIAAQESVTSNRYTILGRLAGGGMADIFLARVISEGGVQRHVVLKRVLAERSLDPQFAKMFLDEARLAAQLQHPNIAQLHDIGRLAGSYFYTMEYVHGEDLRAILGGLVRVGRTIPINLALLVAAQTLAALRHAHTRLGADGKPLGVVHRDVTPSNVMVSYEGSVKLLDFGVAKAAQQTAESRSGTIKGKIAYLSPEQCQNGRVDARSDLFSLGIVLHEMLVLQRLYRRDTDFATMMAIVNEPPPPPSSLRAEVSPALDAIVLKALAKDPAQRFSSAGEMLEAIETIAAQERLAMSSTALGRFLCELVGERPEPWIELRATAEPTVITITGESVPETSPLPGKNLGRIPDFSAEAALQEQLAAAPALGRPQATSDDDDEPRSDGSRSTELAPSARAVVPSVPIAPQPAVSGQIARASPAVKGGPSAGATPAAPLRTAPSGPIPKVVAQAPSGPLRVPASGPVAKPRLDATPVPRPLTVPPPTSGLPTRPPPVATASDPSSRATPIPIVPSRPSVTPSSGESAAPTEPRHVTPTPSTPLPIPVVPLAIPTPSAPFAAVLPASSTTPAHGTPIDPIATPMPLAGAPAETFPHGPPTPPSMAAVSSSSLSIAPLRGDPTAAVSPLTFDPPGDEARLLKRRIAIGGGVLLGLAVVIGVAKSGGSETPERPVVSPTVTPSIDAAPEPVAIEPPVDSAPATTPADVATPTPKEHLDQAIAAGRWVEGLAICGAEPALLKSDGARCTVVACRAKQQAPATTFYVAATPTLDRQTRKAIEKVCREQGITLGQRRPVRDPCEANPLTCRK